MSEDDRWSDVIHQVLDALNDANIDDPNTRDVLAEGVRQALESIDDGIDVNIQILGEDELHPGAAGMDVEVVDGGRGENTPPTEGKKPTLRIAEEGETTEKSIPENRPYVTQVKVLQGSPLGGSIPMTSEYGRIALPNNGEPESSWQTIYQGLRPRLYRVSCFPGGKIDVTVDGIQIERLSPGQSIDVEGLAIRVTSPDTTGASGTYLPVQSAWSEE